MYEISTSDENKLKELYSNKTVSLANALVQAREKASLLESKIELLAMYKMNKEIKSREKKDSQGNSYNVHFVEVLSSEIKPMVGKSHALYSQIEAAAIELKQKLYIYRDEQSEQFLMDNLYGAVEYNKGKLTVEFNPSTEHLFYQISTNFTKINLGIALAFKSNGGFQLYKLLKSYSYTLPKVDKSLSQEDQASIAQFFSLSELRLQLGYVDLNQPDIKREGAKRNPDAEKMNSLDKKPKYSRFNDFSKNVLEVGQTEINETSDIFITFETERGPYNRVEGVTFHIQNNVKYALAGSENKKDSQNRAQDNNTSDINTMKMDEFGQKNGMSDTDKADFYDKVLDLIDEKVKLRDVISICEAAEYNYEIIKEKYQLSKKANIDNLIGWMISAIKNDYKDIAAKASKTERDSSSYSFSSNQGFNHMEEQEYDFEQLENLGNKKKSN